MAASVFWVVAAAFAAAHCTAASAQPPPDTTTTTLHMRAAQGNEKTVARVAAASLRAAGQLYYGDDLGDLHVERLMVELQGVLAKKAHEYNTSFSVGFHHNGNAYGATAGLDSHSPGR